MYWFWETAIRPSIELLKARSIVEIGVESGNTSRRILEFCRANGAVLHGIDPHPAISEEEWKQTWGDAFVLHRKLSLNAIPTLPAFDAVLIDGDHNWYTVYHELLLIERQAEQFHRLPVVFLHDIDWPYGRRDLYYNPENIPDAFRQPHRQLGIDKESGSLVRDGGMNAYHQHSIYEHGVKNGVRTAVEDFLRGRETRYTMFEIHGFYGLGILVPRQVLREAPHFERFLNNLTHSPHLEHHIARLEQARLDGVIAQQELLTAREIMHQARQDNMILRGECERMAAEAAAMHQNRLRLEQEVHDERERLRGESYAEQERLQREYATFVETNMLKLQELDTMKPMHARVIHSRSWRWTAPLRTLDQHARSIARRSLIGSIRVVQRVWTALGKPFPRAAHRVRHQWPASLV